MHITGVELEKHFVYLAVGYDCPGYNQKTWRRYHGRAIRSYKNKGEWIFCPECAREIDKSLGKKKRTAPTREPHRFMGNLELWEKNYARLLPKWGTAKIILGDSRNLLKLIRDSQDATLSSPPYAEARVDGGGDNTQNVVMPDGSYPRGHDGWAVRKQASDKRYGGSDGNLGTLDDKGFEGAVGSPPFGTNSADSQRPSELTQEHADNLGKKNLHGDYGTAPGQIGRMEARDLDGIVGSPPFIAQSGGTNVTAESGTLSDPALFERHSAGNHAKKGYGDEDGQLGAMDEGTLDGVLSSPPYAKSEIAADLTSGVDVEERKQKRADGTWHGYNPDNPANLGTMDEGDPDIAISSPPYAGTLNTGSDQARESDRQHRIDIGRNPDSPGSFNLHDYGASEGQLGALPEGNADAIIASPPFTDSTLTKPSQGVTDQLGHTMGRAHFQEGYADNSPGQLGAMPDKDYDASVASPPFADSLYQIDSNRTDEVGQMVHRPWNSGMQGVNTPGKAWGKNEGQMGQMKDEGYDEVVSSPPFTGSTADGGWQMLGKYAEQGKLTVEQVNGDPNKSYPSWDQNRDTQYAPSPDNLGGVDSDTFWGAARKIVEQTYLALKPGGHALWVVKAYVRDKKIVDFPDQWRRLCESVGFVTVHVHRASLVEDKGTQYDLFGNAIKTETKRYSFFRRLHAQKYPDLEIRHETVLCMEKPA